MDTGLSQTFRSTLSVRTCRSIPSGSRRQLTTGVPRYPSSPIWYQRSRSSSGYRDWRSGIPIGTPSTTVLTSSSPPHSPSPWPPSFPTQHPRSSRCSSSSISHAAWWYSPRWSRNICPLPPSLLSGHVPSSLGLFSLHLHRNGMEPLQITHSRFLQWR